MVPVRGITILRRTDGAILRAMCGVLIEDIDRSEDLMLMLGLSETMDQLA